MLYILEKKTKQQKEKTHIMKISKETKEAVNEALDTLMKGKEEGGEITVEKIHRKVGSAVNRQEVIGALRHNMRGVFIPGRRGYKSRFAFGDYATTATTTSAVAERPKRPKSSHDGDGSRDGEGLTFDGEDFGLKASMVLTNGDRETVIPFKVQVTPA